MKMYSLSIQNFVWRMYLLLAIVTAGLFIGGVWLYIGIVMGYSIVMSCMLGLSFRKSENAKTGTLNLSPGKVVGIPSKTRKAG